jgi:hypothetical protein
VIAGIIQKPHPTGWGFLLFMYEYFADDVRCSERFLFTSRVSPLRRERAKRRQLLFARVDCDLRAKLVPFQQHEDLPFQCRASLLFFPVAPGAPLSLRQFHCGPSTFPRFDPADARNSMRAMSCDRIAAASCRIGKHERHSPMKRLLLLNRLSVKICFRGGSCRSCGLSN